MKKCVIFFSLMPMSLSCMVQNASIERIASQSPRVIIFDLGGLFFKTNNRQFVEAAGGGSLFNGICSIASYTFWDRKNPLTEIEKRLFEMLAQLDMKPEEGFKPTTKHGGAELPYALCAYQAGRIKSEEIRTQALSLCDRLNKEKFFVSIREYSLMRSFLESMFTPQVHAQATAVLPGGIEILKEVATLKNPDNSKKYILVALSNWDRESFEYVAQQFKEELSCFDVILVSGTLGTIKPNAQAYQAVCDLELLKRNNIKKEDCIFVDDQPENIKAGNAFGIRSLLVKKDDAANLRAVLTNEGILPARPRQSSILSSPNVKTATIVLAGLLLVSMATYARSYLA